MKKQIKKNKKGFTLVEMIVVIAIIGVLAAMMVPSLLGFIDKANTSNNRAAATNIGRSAQTVLAELNDSTIAGTYVAKAHSTAAKGIERVTALTTDGGFDAAITNLMSSDKFKGSFAITIAGGAVTRVNYKQDSTCTSVSVTTKSNKTTGVYPES